MALAREYAMARHRLALVDAAWPNTIKRTAMILILIKKYMPNISRNLICKSVLRNMPKGCCNCI